MKEAIIDKKYENLTGKSRVMKIPGFFIKADRAGR